MHATGSRKAPLPCLIADAHVHNVTVHGMGNGIVHSPGRPSITHCCCDLNCSGVKHFCEKACMSAIWSLRQSLTILEWCCSGGGGGGGGGGIGERSWEAVSE